MCGILGEFSLGPSLMDKNEFVSLLDLSKTRGPDYQGYESDNNLYQLGHNRLSIIDLSPAGRQPMVSPSGRYLMVFNGEIYNHLEIRKDLKKEGYEFKGTGDSETLIYAFDHYGLEVVKRLNGIFSIGLIDKQNSKCHLIRDFAGVKPLHFGFQNDRLVFASQYDQIADHPDYRESTIDNQVLKTYLKMHYVPAPLGLLNNTHQVAPGEIVTIDRSGMHKEKYWELPLYQKPEIFDREEALELVDHELEKSVKQQMLADVPLGTFLSGGIDSPLITYYAHKHSPRLSSYTIGSDSKIHDESEDAKTYARLIGVDLNLTRMTSGDAADIWPEAMASLKEPFADYSIIPTYLVSKLASQNVKVSLSGDGGDELFCGYERFISIGKNASYYNLPKVIRMGIYGWHRKVTKSDKVNSCILAESPGVSQQGLHSRLSEDIIHHYFPELKEVSMPAAFDVYDYPKTSNIEELVQYIRHAEFYGMMQKTLRKVDRASMQNSLEVRVPFLSKEFIESSLKIDPFLSLDIKKRYKKKVLKDCLRNNVPEAPIDQRKRGFSIPLGKWIREQLKDDFKTTLSGYPDLLDSHFKEEKNYKWALFTLYSYEQWKKSR